MYVECRLHYGICQKSRSLAIAIIFIHNTAIWNVGGFLFIYFCMVEFYLPIKFYLTFEEAQKEEEERSNKIMLNVI